MQNHVLSVDDNERYHAKKPHPFLPKLTHEHIEKRLQWIRQYVAKPITGPIANFTDPHPAACHYGRVLIGNKYHAAAVLLLKQAGVTAVLNCASGGISTLPVDELKEAGIEYNFTNCRQDHYNYPLLHDLRTGEPSEHFKVAAALYQDAVVRQHGKILFFCVAGQNRSAALAVGVLLLFGFSLDLILPPLGKERPFILENIGFQQQLVELEHMIQTDPVKTRQLVLEHLSASSLLSRKRTSSLSSLTAPPSPVVHFLGPIPLVEIELLIPGLCTMEVQIPRECTVSAVKRILQDHANIHLLSFLDHKNKKEAAEAKIAKSWIVLAMFGYDDTYDVPLEEDAISLRIQIERMRTMFNLKVTRRKPKSTKGLLSLKRAASVGSISGLDDDDEWIVTWNERCRFALVIFSVYRTVPNPNAKNETMVIQEPWTFVHEERPGAPATFLENTLNSTHLRAWDFVSGKAFCSLNPIVFCYAGTDESNVGRIDRRAFMKVSTSAHEPLQYHEPGQILPVSDDKHNDDNSGYILGMGENAIVHRVQLRPTSADNLFDDGTTTTTNGKNNAYLDMPMLENHNSTTTATATPPALTRVREPISMDEDSSHANKDPEFWDAAVKRPYTLDKMLASLNTSSSEAGLAKRLRFANILNTDGRIVEFYGLGIAFACNAYYPTQYKYELVLLSKYERRFATRTLKRFMEDFIRKIDPTVATAAALKEKARLEALQSNFTLISVKVLLVSLLNAFRDLTLMGVRSFDFNHMNNVLVSRDFQSVRLVDIDGGCISTDYANSNDNHNNSHYGPHSSLSVQGNSSPLWKPGLEVDLNFLLPDMVCQLLLGKGRGVSFVTNIRSKIWHAKDDEAKEIIKSVLQENFYSHIGEYGQNSGEYMKAQHHLHSVAHWYHAVLKKSPPWKGWTNDIYDAMRCIDHMPIA